jgi:hypothetical protein
MRTWPGIFFFFAVYKLLSHEGSEFKYASRNCSLRREFEDRLKGFKYCAEEFSLFTAPLSFDVKRTGVNVRMELIGLQYDRAKRKV